MTRSDEEAVVEIYRAENRAMVERDQADPGGNDDLDPHDRLRPAPPGVDRPDNGRKNEVLFFNRGASL